MEHPRPWSAKGEQDPRTRNDEPGSNRQSGLTANATKELAHTGFRPEHDVKGLMKVARDGPIDKFLELWDGVDLNSQVDCDTLTDANLKHQEYVENHRDEEKVLRDKYSSIGKGVVPEDALTEENEDGDEMVLENALIEKYGVVEGRLFKKALTALHPGKTALHMAATNGQWEIVGAICSVESVQMNKRDIFGYTPLHLASLSPHPDRKLVIEQLMEKNVHDRLEANAASHAHFPYPDGNYTPLHFAVRGNFKKIVDRLLRWNPSTGKYRDRIIDVNARSTEGWTPLHLAVKERPAKKGVDKAHVKAKSLIAALIKFINKNCPESINTPNEHKRTPLHTSVDNGDYEVVGLLLDQGDKIDPEAKDKDGKTPIEIAIQKGDYPMVQKLQNYLERVGLYGSEKAYADAASAILVVAALIATLTFNPWAVVSNDESSSVLFWVFSSLSFYFAIATLLSGAGAAMPSRGSTLANVRSAVYAAAVCLAISLSCAVGAFATAAFIIVPSDIHNRRKVIATTAVGGFVCFYFLVVFLRKLASAYSPLFVWVDYRRKAFIYKHVSIPIAKRMPKRTFVSDLKAWYKRTVTDPEEILESDLQSKSRKA